ncbi:hypothetical protein QBC33DRAFT_90151 [Phialemonium atrogriseum]|uniref:Uncharacterized protein n=1 Tax=Phialemonium atrogriseum TaxID=1093897 RepID=A0AAJ0FLM3_9PEZI|nr:uncharacterized protein QBC33DRAFT_90151 [Phialemonium atrogriseum]KAK1766814.1 hypothetical protein QBC33DRAFT_90151 [Phialemonium atrogriseum]
MEKATVFRFATAVIMVTMVTTISTITVLFKGQLVLFPASGSWLFPSTCSWQLVLFWITILLYSASFASPQLFQWVSLQDTFLPVPTEPSQTRERGKGRIRGQPDAPPFFLTQCNC